MCQLLLERYICTNRVIRVSGVFNRNYKSNIGLYRLHKVNQIIDDEVGRIPDTTYRFINI